MAIKPPIPPYTETFLRNNTPVPPLTTDSTRWNRLIITNKDYAAIRLMNDSTLNYHFKIDTAAKTALLYSLSDTLNKSRLTYTKDTAYLTLTGKLGSDTVFIKLKKYDEKRFRLISRGFHWVNEYPLNR